MENITENNEIELNTQKDFDAILLKFLLHEPFFSHIVRCMRKEMTYSIPTAGVSCANGDIVLYWNPNFLSKLTTKKVFGLLKHECYHLIYQHVTSRKQDPHLMWNIATDLAINSTIPKSELPDGGLIPGERCIEVENSYAPEKAQQLSDFIASLPKGKSSEWYMEIIMSSDENQELIKEMFTPPSLEDLLEQVMVTVAAMVMETAMVTVMMKATKATNPEKVHVLDLTIILMMNHHLLVTRQWLTLKLRILSKKQQTVVIDQKTGAA